MIRSEVEKLREEVVALRRDFHMHPELGTQEFRTAEKVEEYLHSVGIRTERMFKTGVVGYLEGAKPGKTLLLRADMDALPVQEINEFAYRSQNDGVMHACGHDGHTAMLLCAAKILAAHKDELCGRIKFVFQPNEEEGGAHQMVEEGVLENPKVDASFGFHLWSQLPAGTVGLKSGPVMAEMYNFRIRLTGKSGHTSAPQEGIDPILCAANIIQSVQLIQSREIGPMDATCIVFGKIHGGTKSNIIAGTVEMEGTLRYLYDGDDDGPQHPRKRFERIVHGICEAHRVTGEVTFEVSNYILINEESAVRFLSEKVFPKIVPSERIIPFTCMGGEDFSEFTNRNHVPGAFVFLGIADPGKGTDHPHHAPDFNIDESMLPVGVEAFVRIALEFLQ